MWTSHGKSRYASGENDVVVRPSVYWSPKLAVIHVHGVEAGAGAADWMSVPVRIPIFKSIADSGYTIIAGDLGGSGTWGNETAQNHMSSAYTYSQSLSGVRAGKVILVAQSMGAVNAMVWAKNNKSKVAAVVLIIPVCNLSDLAENSIYGDSIRAAYGGSYSEAVNGAARNPKTFSSSLTGIPFQIWYGIDDTLCKPADTLALAAGIGANVEMRPCTGGHADSTVAQIVGADLAAFLDANSQ